MYTSAMYYNILMTDKNLSWFICNEVSACGKELIIWLGWSKRIIGRATGQPKRASVRSINPPKRVNEQRFDRFTFYTFVGLLGRAWRARGSISNENTRPVKRYKSRNGTLDGVREKFIERYRSFAAAAAPAPLRTYGYVLPFFRDRLHVSVMNLRSSVKRRSTVRAAFRARALCRLNAAR